MTKRFEKNLKIEEFCLSENIKKIHECYSEELKSICCDFPSLKDPVFFNKNLLMMGTIFEDFIARLFNNSEVIAALQAAEQKWAPLWMVKRQFVQRRALKKYSPDDIDTSQGLLVEKELKKLLNCPLEEEIDELKLSQAILRWMDEEEVFQEALEKALYYFAFKIYKTADKKSLFLNPSSYYKKSEEIYKNSAGEWTAFDSKNRSFFSLTDEGLSPSQALAHSHYCLWCHMRNKDSCRTGITLKDVKGCPLDQKISEMIYLKSQGLNIAALAIAMVDNPLIALTGHRICQDCSKSCIYQKQAPVEVPGVETQIFESVLNLPWGIEIYYLLSHWNPFNLDRPFAREQSGKRVLVVGLGPAGLNLAYHLMQDGHEVIGVDGLKIEPLSHKIRNFMQPIKWVKDIFEDLDQRLPQGFGGVAEYGITSRWNKNYLTVVRLLLERRSSFSVFGGVYFEAEEQMEEAFKYVDHIALCTGARKPRIIPLKRNNSEETGYIKGVRFANDFLMTLQGAGAFHPQSLVNLTLELPVVVIGGGLTAIDTATEALAYYPRHLLRFWDHYQALIKKDSNFLSQFEVQERKTIEQWLNHALLLKKEQEEAHLQQRAVNFLPLLKQWGGVTICYRGDLHDSPSYRQSLLEVEEALKEGVIILDNTQLVSVQSDSQLQLTSVILLTPSGVKEIPARTLLLATGMTHIPVSSAEEYPFLYKKMGSQCISYFGDAHPHYQGSVVKAMASAKEGYSFISAMLRQSSRETSSFPIKQLFTATVVSVVVVSDGCKLRIHYPWGARHYQAGNFFRLQLYQGHFSEEKEYLFEGIPLQVCNIQGDYLEFLLQSAGASSQAYQKVQPGTEVTLTGPTGKPYVIPQRKKVLIVLQDMGIPLYFPLLEKISLQNTTFFYGIGSQEKYKDELKKLNIECQWSASFKEAESYFLKLSSLDHIIVLGNSTFTQQLEQCFPPSFTEIPTTAVCCPPMQCTMKGLCGQCIQSLSSGEVVFACENMYHSLPMIDYSMTEARLRQNTILEKIARCSLNL